MKSETLAKWLVAFSGIAWGLFWLPLYQLEKSGFTPLWAVIIFNLLPSLLILPVAVARWKSVTSGGRLIVAAGIAMGITQIFYALALLNTEVVRAITLFYLNPVWTAILARLLLGEKLGGVGIIAMLFAFIGMALVLHTGFSLPLPQSAGDWYAILAGIAWATSVILLRFQPEGDPVALTVHALIWTGIGLLPVIWLAWDDVPAMALVVAEFWWLLPFVIGVLMTGVFASMWAVPKLSPNLVSLLYMTEISTAAVTAALFSNQPFTLTDGIGVALIALAGALTSIVQMARARTALRAKEDY